MSVSLDEVRTLDAAHVVVASALRDGGVETPSLDARVLLCHATGLSHEAVIAQGRDPLVPEAAARLAGYVARRVAGEPVSRIKGVREFFGWDFRIDAHTLDPRPDTETLVGAALQTLAADGLAQRPIRVLDLGTGSGCILITLLAELPLAEGTGTDMSPGALRRAAENAARLGVADRAWFLAADWFEGLSGRFDLIVANPPYIASGEIAGLAREVAAHDPMRALDGGADGLEAYRRIAARAVDFLSPEGHLLVEIGPTQAQAVLGLFRAAGLIAETDGVRFDLAGRPRCIQAESPFRGGAEGRRGSKISLENRHVRGSFEAAN